MGRMTRPDIYAEPALSAVPAQLSQHDQKEKIMTTTADLLDEYGQALRGSWGDIDGRSEKLALLELSAAIREHGNDPIPEDTVLKLRDDLNLCQEGGAHWGWYCDETWAKCEPEEAGR